MDDRSPLWLQTKMPIETTGTPSVFLSGKFWLHFDLNIMIPLILKGFFMKQMAQIHQILKQKIKNNNNPNCQIFVITSSSR
jgi:hypothetical protein